MKRLSHQTAAFSFEKAEITRNGAKLQVRLDYHGAYGMGEKFDSLNQKGRTVINEVREKFCSQGDNT